MMRRTPLLFLLLFCLCPWSAFAQRNRGVRRFPVSGNVRSATTNEGLDGLQVELRSAEGGLFASTVTSGNGRFEFQNVPADEYMLVVSGINYQTVNQPLSVDAPQIGVSVEMRVDQPKKPTIKGPSIISARELSIPHKAHDAMEKGLQELVKPNYPESLKDFKRAIQLYPGYYEAYQAMGVAYDRLGDANNAEQAERKSVELSDSHYPEALVWLASLLSDQSRFAESEPYARKGAEIAPNSWQAKAELARALFGLNRVDESEMSARAAVDIQPKEPTLRLLLAEIHGAQQNQLALLDDLNAYLELAPASPNAGKIRQQRDALQDELAKH